MRLTLSFLILLLGLPAQASDLFAPFQGSRVSGLTRSSTIAEYDGTTDAAGNLLDLSGSNYCPASEQMDLWTLGSVYTSVVANQYRSPIDNQLSADSVKEYGASGGGDATAYHYIQKNMGAASAGVRYTNSGYFKKVNRSWVMLQPYDATAAAERARASFNLDTGVASSLLAGTTATITKVSGGWYRLSVSWVQPTDSLSILSVFSALEGDNDRQYAGSDQVAFAVVGAQMAKNDQWRQGPGIYHPTTNSVTKPLLDLAPTSAPTSAYSYLQNRDGNRLQARAFNGAGQYYNAGNSTAFNVFDTNSTITIVALSNAAQIIDAFNSGTAGGVIVRHSNIVRWYKADGNYVDLNGPADYSTDGKYHTYQVVRSNDIATLIIDGVAGTPKSVAGYGIDAVPGLSPSVGSTSFAGTVLYTRVDSTALSHEELAKDREALQGTLMGSGNLAPGSTFTRTTTASMTYTNGTIGYVAANVPRVGGDGGGVLIEEQRENKALQSQTFGTTWTKRAGDGISADSATILAPDGTATADGLIGEAVSESHYFAQNVTLTAATWTISMLVKAGNNRWALLSNNTVATANVLFDVSACKAISPGVLATAYGTQQYADGWCRCWFSHTATAASSSIVAYSIDNAGGVLAYTGDGATVNTWFWGAQVELGAHPTSYITTTSAAVTRTQDSLTLEPWKLNKGVNPGNANPTMTARFESDVYSAGTYTSETGGYAFTVAGDVKHQSSQTLGDWFAFDGTGDYLTIAESTFNPAGDFTATAIVTPSTISGSHVIAGKYNTVGDQRGWMMSQSDANVSFIRTTDGKVGTVLTATCTSCLVAGKTALITGSYSTTGGLAVRVDGYSAGTQAATGVVHPSTASFTIANDSGTSYFTGKIHSVKYIPGYAATQTDHDNAYAQLKQANVLPVKVGNSYEAKKLYIDFDTKCNFASKAEVNTYPIFVQIGGNTGTADTDSNRILILYSYLTGVMTTTFYGDNDTTQHVAQSLEMLDMNKWKTHKLYIDFANMANNSYTVNGVAGTWVNNSGTENFNFTDTKIRVGQSISDIAVANCRIKNLRVRAAP